MNLGGCFDYNSKLNELGNLNEIINDSKFWDDKETANAVICNQKEVKEGIDTIDNFTIKLKNDEEMLELLKEEYDNSIVDLLNKEMKDLEIDIENFEIKTLMNGKYDKNNCILEIHSGAGGTESCDWVSMLYRMYTRWCEKNNYKYELLDYQAGEEVGIKTVSILIKGIYASGYLKSEKGIHRLVRLSPFDSNNRRHTTFASVDVIPEFDNNISIDIKDEDLKIDVYRSSGAGGQSVNTTDSAVRITHLPTKTVVTCQNERSQLKNKEKAMQILKNKLYLLEMETKEKELADLKGDHKEIDFGSQIRSYVMHPYSMVKDHRTTCETSNVLSVLDGNINMFIEAYLKEVV